MTALEIAKPFGFRLAAARAFYAGFTPGSGMAAASTDDELVLAFRLDRTYEAVAVALRERGDSIVGEVVGTRDLDAVAGQVSRILGLEVDGKAWLAVGARDEVVGRLQARYAGFFTAAKASPYDAATWSIIAPRLNIAQAARIKTAIAEAHGDAVVLHGRTYHVFPAPDALARIETIAGLADVKRERLRGIAAAAIAGQLDADRLRAMDECAALAELQELDGIGPWGASHIYYRGAAVVDALPTAEPRVLHAFGLAYGVEPSEANYRRIGRAWSPFAMWVAILLMRDLARTDEWNAPHLRAARAKAGKKLSGARSRA
jgi:DNA-3-methyladenine glycosylase II